MSFVFLRFLRAHAPQFVVALAIVAAGAVFRFTGHTSSHGHGDEQITIQVLRSMRESGDWDVNWAKANLTPDLQYDQYNFSSHLYTAFFFYELTKFLPGTEAWRGERQGALVYRFLGALLATLAIAQTLRLGYRAGGWSVALTAAAIVGASVLLVQDAHYVRPEPFTVVLTLAAITLAWPQPSLRPARILGSAFVVGVLVACKISMLLLAWVPLVPLLSAARGVGPRPRWIFVALPVALFAGFATGAPTAVTHPGAFLNGIKHLMTQYGGRHPPFSHVDGSAVADMLGKYWLATLGWPVVTCFAAGLFFLLRRRRWPEMFLLVGPIAAFGGYFATRSVFFERNLSHVVPLFAIVAALGAVELALLLANRMRPALPLLVGGLAVLLVLRTATLSYRLVFLEYGGRAYRQKSAFEADLRARYADAELRSELFLAEGPLIRLTDRFRSGSRAVLLRVADFRDDWTATLLPQLAQRLVADEVGVFPGTFPDLPVCTLLTYHSAVERYFLVTAVRGGSPPPPP